MFLVVSVSAQLVNGTACHTDSECMSYCCNNNQDYTVEGVCIEVAEDERCKLRKRNDIIGLVCIVISFWIVVVACAIVKIKQVKAHKEELEAIRIHGISMAANEGPAPQISNKLGFSDLILKANKKMTVEASDTIQNQIKDLDNLKQNLIQKSEV